MQEFSTCYCVCEKNVLQTSYEHKEKNGVGAPTPTPLQVVGWIQSSCRDGFIVSIAGRCIHNMSLRVCFALLCCSSVCVRVAWTRVFSRGLKPESMWPSFRLSPGSSKRGTRCGPSPHLRQGILFQTLKVKYVEGICVDVEGRGHSAMLLYAVTKVEWGVTYPKTPPQSDLVLGRPLTSQCSQSLGTTIYFS